MGTVFTRTSSSIYLQDTNAGQERVDFQADPEESVWRARCAAGRMVRLVG